MAKRPCGSQDILNFVPPSKITKVTKPHSTETASGCEGGNELPLNYDSNDSVTVLDYIIV